MLKFVKFFNKRLLLRQIHFYTKKVKIDLEVAGNSATLEYVNSAGIWQGVFKYKDFQYSFQHNAVMTYDTWVDQGNIMLTNHIIWDIIRTKYPNRSRPFANLERSGNVYKATFDKYLSSAPTSKAACERLLNLIRL